MGFGERDFFPVGFTMETEEAGGRTVLVHSRGDKTSL